MKKLLKIIIGLFLLFAVIYFGAERFHIANIFIKDPEIEQAIEKVSPKENYVVLNNNIPKFDNKDITSTNAYEDYGNKDLLGRVTQANAVLGTELMPDKVRGDISSVKPTGWQQAKYNSIEGGWLYNRCHLIGYQLTGENDNSKNLMTGTRQFNVEGMLPFENYVADYIERTNNHVRYRVTPYFKGINALASGVIMEGFSIEDNGKGICFNLFIPNHQKGITIDYLTGNSSQE
ncbi:MULTISPECIES: DNA/RNA non-specific endonuclease [Aerococcus]|uniref:DNA/RNA non-specific endonuclease n=1 Tax=Aerococcus TaxID=1375 RepID=UPI0018A7CF10|nr:MULTISPECIES: DNA/RNA non-specific endonuclease [Aerococcus]MCY3067623.1 DNA/RNA non-specific endonuclease [Aerococcus mictus]MCY3080475.1 DNA/RNA non-specific endonuclease [Aerococcus mictus]MDK8484538.1 DNA/RNA non-specific endonuclease [Aerococcus urinae]